MAVDNTRKLRLSLFVLLFIFCFEGCAGISRVRYSKPALDTDTNLNIESKFEKYVGDVFVTEDVDFRVEPLNSAATSFPVLPLPLPIPMGEDRVTTPPFLVSVALKPHKSDAVFNPQKVYFWEDPSQRKTPMRIEGPYDCTSSVPRPNKRLLPIEPFELKKNIFNCMWLEFNVPPPDPSKIFFIEIDGLVFNSKTYPLPAIRFEEAKRTTTFAVP